MATAMDGHTHATVDLQSVFPGASETAARCRAFDWGGTELGPVASWSHSLRTTVGTLLTSRQPMFLFWGRSLVQFHNDAYRPSLGTGGRADRALGACGREFWTEIWDVIGPQIEQVMTTGEATWHEDQHLPIERNGRLEDVWWTYSYSPVRDDDGRIAATLVVCQETTPRVAAERERERLVAALRAERDQLEYVFRHAPAFLSVVRGPQHVMELHNEAYYRMVGRRDVTGRPLAEALPELREQGFIALLDRVLETGEPYIGREIPAVLARTPGAPPEERFVDFVAMPVVEADGSHSGIVAQGIDVTDHVHARREVERLLADSQRARADAELVRVAAERDAQITSGITTYLADGICVMDAGGRLTYMNPAAERILGWTADELRGEVLHDRVHYLRPDGRPFPMAECPLGCVLTAGEAVLDLADQWVRRDGTFVHVVTTCSPITVDGCVTGAVLSLHDDTERRRAEAERERLLAAERAARERATAVLESISDAFYAVDADFRFTYVNHRAEELWGRSRASLVGRHYWTEFPQAVGSEAHRRHLSAMAERRAARFETRSPILGRWIDVNLYPESGGGLACYFRDITDRHEAEAERERLLAEVAAERERLRTVVLQAPAPLALLEGPEHRFALVNDAYKRVSGGGRDVTGLTPPEAFPELAGTGIYELFDRVYETGEPWFGPETRIRYDRDGTGVIDTWFDLRLEPVRDADGRVTAVFNFCVDVTEQVRARRQVERLLAESERARAEAEAARRDAEAANRSKSEFLATMSHELRTPLNAIGGYAELIELGIHGPVTEAQRTALERIQQSQRHLLGLIAGVLDYSRVEAGAVTYRLVEVPVAEAVGEAEALVAPQLRAKGLGYAWSGAAQGLAVRADREKLQQILLNLLGNAIKFTHPRDGVPGRIDVACVVADGAEGERVVVRVRDTGEGIAAEQIERIFEPFVQADQRLTRPHAGVGLGLAISRDLARGMGGELTAESEVGVGSTFVLTLPRA